MGCGNVSPEQRRQKVAEFICRQRFASLPELADALDVSESTIRRDLEVLDQEGVVHRTHGGAFFAGDDFEASEGDGNHSGLLEAKQQIACQAAPLVEDGDAIILDGGSTTFEVAKLLVGRGLHVITNSLPVANLFATDPECDLIMIGENVCPRTKVARGPLADSMLRTMRVRKTILSVAGVHEEGLFNNNMLLVETERAMIEAADETIVVADGTKFGRRSIGHVAAIDAVDTFVVDTGLAPSWRERLQQSDVRLIQSTGGRPTAAEPSSA